MSDKKQEQLTSAKEICETHGIPFDATARALQLMAQQGIVQAAQGAHGGYNVAKDLNMVSLRDLNNIIMGPINIADCLKENISRVKLNNQKNVCQVLLVVVVVVYA